MAHGLQCLCDGARVVHHLPFLEVSPTPVTLVFQLVVALDWYPVRVGLNFPRHFVLE